MKELLSRLDYAGISILVWGSSMPPIIYCFCCKPTFWVRNWFIVLMSFTSICSFLACILPGANTPKWRPFRAYVYIALGLSVGIPFFYSLYPPDD